MPSWSWFTSTSVLIQYWIQWFMIMKFLTCMYYRICIGVSCCTIRAWSWFNGPKKKIDQRKLGSAFPKRIVDVSSIASYILKTAFLEGRGHSLLANCILRDICSSMVSLTRTKRRVGDRSTWEPREEEEISLMGSNDDCMFHLTIW